MAPKRRVTKPTKKNNDPEDVPDVEEQNDLQSALSEDNSTPDLEGAGGSQQAADDVNSPNETSTDSGALNTLISTTTPARTPVASTTTGQSPPDPENAFDGPSTTADEESHPLHDDHELFSDSDDQIDESSSVSVDDGELYVEDVGNRIANVAIEKIIEALQSRIGTPADGHKRRQSDSTNFDRSQKRRRPLSGQHVVTSNERGGTPKPLAAISTTTPMSEDIRLAHLRRDLEKILPSTICLQQPESRALANQKFKKAQEKCETAISLDGLSHPGVLGTLKSALVDNTVSNDKVARDRVIRAGN